MKYQENVKPFLKEVPFKTVLLAYFKVMEMCQAEELFQAFQKIMNLFGGRITPFALEIVQNIVS
jgi:hypothetical protein